MATSSGRCGRRVRTGPGPLSVGTEDPLPDPRCRGSQSPGAGAGVCFVHRSEHPSNSLAPVRGPGNGGRNGAADWSLAGADVRRGRRRATTSSSGGGAPCGGCRKERDGRGRRVLAASVDAGGGRLDWARRTSGYRGGRACRWGDRRLASGPGQSGRRHGDGWLARSPARSGRRGGSRLAGCATRSGGALADAGAEGAAR